MQLHLGLLLLAALCAVSSQQTSQGTKQTVFASESTKAATSGKTSSPSKQPAVTTVANTPPHTNTQGMSQTTESPTKTSANITPKKDKTTQAMTSTSTTTTSTTTLPPPSLSLFVERLLEKMETDPFFQPLVNGSDFGPVVQLIASYENSAILQILLEVARNSGFQHIRDIIGDAFKDIKLPNTNDSAEVVLAFVGQVQWLDMLHDVADALVKNTVLPLPPSIKSTVQTVVDILGNQNIWNTTSILWQEVSRAFPQNSSITFTLADFLGKFNLPHTVYRVTTEVDWGSSSSTIASIAQIVNDTRIQAALKVVIKHLGREDLIAPTQYSARNIVNAMLSKTQWSKLIIEALDAGLEDYLFSIPDGPAIAQVLRLVENRATIANAAKFLVPLLKSLGVIPRPMDGPGAITYALSTYDVQYVLSKPRNMSDLCWKQGHMAIKAIQRSKLWGIRMLDAWGKPRTGIQRGALKWLGSYDECVSIDENLDASELSAWNVSDPLPSKVKGKACRVDALPPSSIADRVKEKIWLDSPSLKNADSTVSLLVCVPDICNAQDIEAMMDGIFSLVSMSTEHVECWDEKDDTAPANYIILGVLAALVLVVLCMTVLDYCVKEPRRKSYKEGRSNDAFELKEQSPQAERELPVTYDLVDEEAEHQPSMDLVLGGSSSLWLRLVRCFSLRRVLTALLTAEHGTWSVPAVHGMRFMSIAWIMCMHTLGFQAVTHPGMPTTSNLLEALDWLRGADMAVLLQGDYSIDTLFVISAVLTSYCFYRHVENSGGRPSALSVVYYYLHRIWRLTPLYAVILFFAAYMHEGSGPMWPVTAPEATCRNDWWKNLLYINNLFPTHGSKEVCFKWTWALALVMQFYIFAPLFMALIFKFAPVGITVTLMGVVASGIGTAVLYDNVGGGLIEKDAYYDEIFVKPWTRCSPYLLGLIAGYIMYQKQHTPRLNKVGAFFCWLLALTIVCLLVFLPHTELCEGCSSWPHWGRTLFEGLRRPLWGLAISYMIVACYCNAGGIANSILSWEGFIPLSRLSFGAFLLHPIVMFMFTYNKRTQLYADKLTLVTMWGSYMVITYCFALVFATFVEIPLRMVERVIIFRQRTK